MKILHFSDTHLGYNEWDKVGKNGVNIREQDFYATFIHVVDKAIEWKVDLVIHSGDFFHRPTPANRPMIFALEQLTRLQNAGIPIAIIAGNHETPKTVFTSPILQAFQTIEVVTPFFSQFYEKKEFGNVVVHGLPHINDDAVMLDELDKIKPLANKRNILMLHTSIGKNYIMEEYGEKLFPQERLKVFDKFDYVALGHWHNFQKIKSIKNAFYCGSTERMSDTEWNKEKGFCLLDFGNPFPEPEFHKVPARPWYRIDIKNCHEKTIEEITSELKQMISEIDIQDAIISLYLNGLKDIQSIELTNRDLTALFEGSVHVTIKRKFVDDLIATDFKASEVESLDKLMAGFIKTEIDNPEKSEKLIEKSNHYFSKFEASTN